MSDGNGSFDYCEQEWNYWICYADDGLAEATKAEPHLTKFNQAVGGCGEHPWSSGGTLSKKLLEPLLEAAKSQALTALLEAMPEKRPDLHKGNIELGRMSGFNEAIDQVTAIIEGQIGGKKL